ACSTRKSSNSRPFPFRRPCNEGSATSRYPLSQKPCFLIGGQPNSRHGVLIARQALPFVRDRSPPSWSRSRFNRGITANIAERRVELVIRLTALASEHRLHSRSGPQQAAGGGPGADQHQPDG